MEKAGAAAEFERRFHTYNRLVYRIAYTYTANREDAEDIMQEVFLKHLRGREKFECEEQLKFWLIRVTVNISKNLLRSFSRSRRAELDDSLPTGQEDMCEEVADVYSAVMTLPVDYRQAVHLFYYEDLTVAQIAKITGKSENLIKVRLSRARDLLRTKLKGDYDYEIQG